jgi:hypothetical protein
MDLKKAQELLKNVENGIPVCWEDLEEMEEIINPDKWPDELDLDNNS